MTTRDPGMNRMIARRDFFGGIAVAISGSMAWRWTQAQDLTDKYPPLLTGMHGSHEGPFEVVHTMRDGVRWDNPDDNGEQYDLISLRGNRPV
jgi:spermidine dehydrogenase